jgi:hypothetical protein
MCSMKMNMLVRTGLHILFFLVVYPALGQALKKGVFILVSQKGEVTYTRESGEQAPKVGVGQAIPQNYTILTGKDSELVGLLSTGTLLTLASETRMNVKTFEQEAFDGGGRKLSDLKEEPSQSKIELQLDMGSLVVKTKKLNKGSVFDINSPVGVAGIRGTEFQMTSMPGSGVQLDVTESTVAFTPPGGGAPIPVSQGNGLTVPPSGVPQIRAVNPVVAQNIETSNQAATEATQNVSLGEVTAVMEQLEIETETSSDETAEETAEESPTEPQEDDSKQEDAEGREDVESVEETEPLEEAESSVDSEKEVQKKSDAEEQPIGDEQMVEEAEVAPDSAGEIAQTEEDFSPRQSKEENSLDLGESPLPSAEGDATSEQPSVAKTGDRGGAKQTEPQAAPSAVPENKPTPEAKQTAVPASANQQTVPIQDKSLILDNNPEFKLRQELSKFGLSEAQVDQYSGLGIRAQEQIKKEVPAVVTRLFDASNFKQDRVDTFYTYSVETRELILGLDDEIMFTLLDEEFDEELFNESLTKMNIDFSNPVNLPSEQPQDPKAQRLHGLSELLKESGNGWVMDELLEMSGGQLTDEWIRIGEMAEVLLRHSSIDELNPTNSFQTSEVLSNPFYEDIASIFDELELDALVYGDGVMIGASHLIIPDNSLALNPYFGDGVKEVVISASQSLSFEGDISWDAPVGTNEARLVVMSAGDLNIKEGATLQSATSDLILSTREDLVLSQVNLNADREVVIRGMRDVHLYDVGIGATHLAKIKARRDLYADGLTFRPDIAKIVMEATTLRLRNIDFPGSAQVRLNSLKGGIDGRYPNFGTVSAAQQIGRVNFIENIKSGGNLLHNRAAFDQHGRNIQIGKIAKP